MFVIRFRLVLMQKSGQAPRHLVGSFFIGTKIKIKGLLLAKHILNSFEYRIDNDWCGNNINSVMYVLYQK